MNMRNLVVSTAALILVGNFPTAYAEPGAGANTPRTDQAGQVRQKVNRIFNLVDLDGSETLTLDEWLVKPTKKAAAQFDRIDADNDELISLEEFLAIGGARPAPDSKDDRVRDFDLDREAVQACVRDALKTDVAERPEPEERFASLDINDDGFIDFDEFLAGKAEHATARFHAIDDNSDGAITKMEFAKALMQQRKHRQVRRDCIEDQIETEELLG